MRIWALVLYALLIGFLEFEVSTSDDDSKRIINIGLVSDMESSSWEGKVVRSSISMSLGDFYNLNGGYRTRIVLHVRDSKGDSLQSVAAALDLLENVKVQAIIIPQISSEELFLSTLGDKVKVPLLSFSSLPSSHIQQHPYFIQVAEDEINQFHGIASFIKQFKWKNFVYLYEDTADARLSQTYIDNIFQEDNLDIVYRAAISLQATDDQIRNELHKLTSINSSIFVVHLSPPLASKVFVNAKILGMMNEGYAWILTSKAMNLWEPQSSSFCESMEGVVGFRTYIPDSSKLQNFTSRWRKDFQQIIASNFTIREPNIIALWAYDAAWALAEAVENAVVQPSKDQVDVLDTQQFGRIKVSNIGPSIVTALMNSKFVGLAGEFRLKYQKLVQDKYEILNVLCEVERQVGFWTSTYGLTKNISSHDNVSSNILETIVWPGLSSTAPQNSSIQTSRKSFKVGIPSRGRFHELIHTEYDEQGNAVKFTGFCMDVFETALARLPDKLYPEYLPFDNRNNSYTDLVRQVYDGTYDAAGGDITILSNRSTYVDFTVPYTDLGLGVMVKLDNDPWFFLKPLSMELWIVSACSFVLTGFIVWLNEHRINEAFQGSIVQQIGTALWFAVSTLVYAHRERLQGNVSRFVVGVWLFVVLILTSSYIANLSSLLTVAQFKLSKTEYIGYSGTPFLQGLIIKDNTIFSDNRLNLYKYPDQFYEALRKGSKKGGVDAIIEEVPYIRSLVARYPREFAMVKSSQRTSGFGFAFPKGSRLVSEMSKAISQLREEGMLLEMERKWFKGQLPLFSDDNDPPKLKPLNIHQFAGLFLINGTSELIAVLLFFMFLLRERLSTAFRNLTTLSRGILEFILRFLYPRMNNNIAANVPP
ncbi:glutamate receptor 1.2-like isoform X2 [Andrographis paniculata]|uniref:glutamate receptor 1.2-like isoform X2 n=1 Tax=Andrographis paniculata TaxID=175694 RepID=UPI0021E7D115|nr:glutamate receptor 1.2-like isoform X2 [Andrographis paniculata]